MKLAPIKEKITVSEVLQLYPQLGVPHFQRGLVWGNDSVAALLESLYFDTPCGSFVFWDSGANQDHGVPMLNGAKDNITYLVVDGQQRIRSLRQIFDNEGASDIEGSDTAETGEDDRDPDKSWCINLARLNKFSAILEPHKREYGLFVYTTPPDKAKPTSPFRHNVLPIDKLRADDSGYDCQVYLQRRPGRENEDLTGLLEELKAEIRAISQRTFFVTVKNSSPTEMINLYNRINSGGKRVEAEEKAFARLVALYPPSYKHVAIIFNEVHREIDSGAMSGSAHLRRDDVMERQKENQFGFKLFIRTFIQVSNYHHYRSAGSQYLSFDVVHGGNFAGLLSGDVAANSEFLWEETREVLVTARNVLRHELHYDALAFLPDAMSLVPVFQMLIQYPQLREAKYHPLLGWAMLSLLLAYEDSKDILELVAELRDEGEIAMDILPAMLKKLDAEARSKIQSSETLESANSIHNRYVLLLYVLLRRNKVRDFSYDNVPHSKRLAGKETLLICETSRPEKQHIAPFSCLMDSIWDKKAKRGASHRFNNIGNLTYISQELNSFEYGLGPDPINRSIEPKENLEAHFMPDGGFDDAGPLYDGLKRLLCEQNDSDDEIISDQFDRFCAARRRLISNGFESWLDDLRRCAEEVMPLDDARPRLKAITPRCISCQDLPLTQQIRSMNYPDDIEDALVGYVRQFEEQSGFKKRVKRKDDAIELRFSDGGAIQLDMRPFEIIVKFSEGLENDSCALVNSMLGISQGAHYLYGEKRGRVLSLDMLNELSSVSGNLDDREQKKRELAPRKEGRRNLSEEELRQLAADHQVLPLYDQVQSRLRPLFNGATRTQSSLSLVGKINISREAIIGVCPIASSASRGLALVMYVDGVASFFGIPEEDVTKFLGESPCDAKTWWPERTWYFSEKRLDELVQFLSCSRDNSKESDL